ncbi:helix-turn-helix domain-containing protein [Geodermatophilus sp. SYSU D01045]
MQDETAEQRMGRRVRLLRTARGWSQERLAEVMTEHGTPWRQATVARVELAQRPVRVNEAAALAQVFDVELPFLIPVTREEVEAVLWDAEGTGQAIDVGVNGPVRVTLADPHAPHAPIPERPIDRSELQAEIERVVRRVLDERGGDEEG